MTEQPNEDTPAARIPDLAQKYWVQHWGETVEPGSHIHEPYSELFNNDAPAILGDFTFDRAIYEEIWTKLIAHVPSNAKPTLRPLKRLAFLLFGPPGAGKSSLRFKAIREALSLKFCVAVTLSDATIAYFGAKGVEIYDSDETDYTRSPNFEPCAHYIAFFDERAPSPKFYANWPGDIVVISSPNNSRYSDFLKRKGPEILFVPQWSVAEVEAHTRFLVDKGFWTLSSNEYTPVECAEWLGGDARKCFDVPIPKIFDPATDFGEQVQPFLNDEVFTPSVLNLLNGHDTAVRIPDNFHLFFTPERKPGILANSARARRLRLAALCYVPRTSFLATIVRDALRLRLRTQRFDSLRKLLDAPSFRGLAFELLALEHFVEKGFIVRDGFHITLQPHDYVSKPLTPVELENVGFSAGGFYIMPPNFATFDAVVISSDAKTVVFIQVTVARKHKTSLKGFSEVVPRIKSDVPTATEWRFLYATPCSLAGEALMNRHANATIVYKTLSIPVGYAALNVASGTGFENWFSAHIEKVELSLSEDEDERIDVDE